MTQKIECREDKIIETITFLSTYSNLHDEDPRATEDLDDKIHEAWGDLVGSFLEIAESLEIQKRLKKWYSEMSDTIHPQWTTDEVTDRIEYVIKGEQKAQ